MGHSKLLSMNMPSITKSGVLGMLSGAGGLPTPDYETGNPFDPTGWVPQNATNISVSTSGISFKVTGATDTIDNIAYDLGAGNVSDTVWSLRYTVTYTGFSAGSGGENHIIGIGSQSGAVGAMSNPYTGGGGSSTPENRIGFSWVDYAGSPEVGILSSEAWYSNGYPNNSAHTSSNLSVTGSVKYYITIIRHSSTNITMDVKTGSFTGTSVTGYPVTSNNPPSTDGVYGNATPTSSLTDLRYLKIWNRAKEGTRAGYFTGVLDSISFWNNVEIA